MSRPNYRGRLQLNLRQALRFAVGAVLFTLCMRLPFAWWGRPGGWLWWALPFLGCYAYTPRPLCWVSVSAGNRARLARLASRAGWRLRCELAEASAAHLVQTDRRLRIELQAERAERLRLQGALRFWLPRVPLQAGEMTDRAAADAWLLSGHEGLPSEATAEDRGWVQVMGSLPFSGETAGYRQPIRGVRGSDA